MKTYRFKTVNPYASGDSVYKLLTVELPDDFKFCLTKQYPSSGQSFYIFFGKYDEPLIEYINNLCKNKGYSHKHTHAYRINKDYMVGNFWNVVFDASENDNELPLETLDELNARFNAVFSNFLLKTSIENPTLNMLYQQEREYLLYNINDIQDMSPMDRAAYNELMEDIKRESTAPYLTHAIHKILGFKKDEELVVDLLSVYFTSYHSNEPFDNIERTSRKWFQLWDTYNTGDRIDFSYDDTLWDELNTRVAEILKPFNRTNL